MFRNCQHQSRHHHHTVRASWTNDKPYCTPPRRENSPTGGQIEDYIKTYSSGEDELLRQLREETHAKFPWGSHMMVGVTEGLFLKMLVSLLRPARILELGTFTGMFSYVYMCVNSMPVWCGVCMWCRLL